MRPIYKKGLIFITVTTLLLMLVLWFDDSLTPLSQEVLSYQVQIQKEDNGEVFLWCFECQTDDVYQAALMVVNQVNDELVSGTFNEDDVLAEFELYEWQNTEVLCEKFESDCDVFEIMKDDDVSQYLSAHQWAIDRYHQYLGYTFFMDQIGPSDDMPLPGYGVLGDAQRLHHMSLLMRYGADQPDQLLGELTEELMKTKSVLLKANSLIQKMVQVNLISENLELVNQLYQRGYLHNVDLSAFEAQLSLDIKHHDLSAVFKRDYWFWVEFVRKKIDFNKLLENKKTHILNKLFGQVFIRFIYKPNMTINHVTEDIHLPVMLTVLNPMDFYKRARDIPKKQPTSRFRNFLIWRAFKEPKKITFQDYTARIHSLHNKMRLLKNLFFSGSVTAMTADIESGQVRYTSLFDGSLPYVDDEKMCFNSISRVAAHDEYICLSIMAESVAEGVGGE